MQRIESVLSLSDSRSDRLGGLAHGRRELGSRAARHRHDEIEAIEQGPRDSAGMTGQRGRRAGAFQAWGHRVRHMGIGSSSRRASTRAGNVARDDARETVTVPSSSGLPETLESMASELGELVEKEDAPMSEADLARPRPGAASDESNECRRMMWRSEGSLRNETGSPLEKACN